MKRLANTVKANTLFDSIRIHQMPKEECTVTGDGNRFYLNYRYRDDSIIMGSVSIRLTKEQYDDLKGKRCSVIPE